MSYEFDGFDPAFPTSSPPPLRRRKSIGQIAVFLVGNLVILPIMIITHASVAGEGIRASLPVFQRKLWTLPIPGASFARHYDGFDKLDLSFIAAVLLFAIATLVWRKLFLMLNERDGRSGRQPPLAWIVLMTIYVTVIVADAALFWAGLESQTASDWSDTPSYVAPLATGLFTALVAVIAAWHADFHTSRYA